MNVITLRDARASIGGREIGAGFDAGVARGEFVAVLGPNGAGKSTLLKAILGIQPVSGTTVDVLGGAPGSHNSRIGYLPQRRAFPADTRVRGIDIVRLGIDGHKWGTPLPRFLAGAKGHALENRVSEVIDLVGASGYAHRPIGQCSGGEQQRLLIAQALVRSPQPLILDEPLDSLDVTNQASVSGLI